MASNAPQTIATASASWIDAQGGLHLHVFSTDGFTVTERYAAPSTNGWTDGTLSQPATALSATAWVDPNGGHVRVYCTNEDATTEWCLDGDTATQWYQGQYSA
jgi:hypothetical protein